MKNIRENLEVRRMEKGGLLPIFRILSRQRILYRDRDFCFPVATEHLVSRQGWSRHDTQARTRTGLGSHDDVRTLPTCTRDREACRDREFSVATEILGPMSQQWVLYHDKVWYWQGLLGRDQALHVATMSCAQ